MSESSYVFDGANLHLVDFYDHPIQVADSFLVSEGRVRSINKHRDRFSTSVAKLSALDVDAFWDAAMKLIPREGQVFPRLELAGDNLVLRIRDAMDYKPTVTLWTTDEVDDRVDPTTKGPDLGYGTALRRKSNLYGADEAVIVDQDGFICEGALSSLVWWRDDVLYAPDDNTRWLPSITRLEVFDMANQAGYSTATEQVKPEDLDGLEIWSLSSFTGIRPVVDWVNLAGSVGPQRHLESFQRRLKLMASEL
jgi:branched-subunit amino acid aminotransferase/4-amino-4-deoxychorismate lyase